MLNEPVQIRLATVDDIPFVGSMMREALAASPSFLAHQDIEKLRQAEEQEWEEWQRHPYPVFVAVDTAGRRIGAIRLRPHPTDLEHAHQPGYQVGIGVEADVRHQGVGRRLMRHASTYAQDAGATYLTLIVDQTNLPAIRLYRDIGFVEVSQQDGVIEMRLRITAPES